MVDLNDFALEKRCEYKGRIYSVRDNGSVYRHQKEGARLAPLDNKWTFGKKDDSDGYMKIAGVRIHQIVATAFHGVPEDPKMVVDHIDTNRCNNRPENLRWFTKLENALNNPYTRNKIIYRCGSVEAYLNDPSILRQSASEPDISWMRTVTKEESDKCRKHLDRWVQEDNKFKQFPGESKGIGEWIYEDNYSNRLDNLLKSDWTAMEQRKSYAKQRVEIEAEPIRFNEEQSLAIKDSLTPGAKQVNWKVLTEFPLCPSFSSESPLEEYLGNLVQDKTFCQNNLYHSEIVKAELSLDRSHISVITTTSGATNYALTEIRYEEGFFIHKSIRTFFSEKGAEKYYTLSLGKEWVGGDVLEDFC